MKAESINIRAKIREVRDFPRKGTNFKDITPALEDREIFSYIIDSLAREFSGKKIDKIVGIDARGFLLASALAYRLKTGLAIARKKGKLPAKTIVCEYELEYGKDTLEIRQGAVRPREKVLIVDDVLATGGTAAAAAARLVEKSKGKIVGLAFLINLSFLKGAEKLKKYSVVSLIAY